MPLRPQGSRLPLCCVHPASGSAYVYSRLAALLGEDQPVYGLEAPGLEGDREPCTSIDALSAAHRESLRALPGDGGAALLGWSMGGVVAYDLAGRLQAEGVAVPLVILVDAPVPQPDGIRDEREVVEHFLADLVGGGPLPAEAREAVDRLGDVPARLLDHLVRAAIIPPELDAEVLARRYAVFRANSMALTRHRLTVGWPGRPVLVRASETPAELMRWREVVGELTEHTVWAHHYSIFSGPGLEALAGIVRQHLDEVQPRGSAA